MYLRYPVLRKDGDFMISERIRELRKSSGLTQIELAQKLNVSYGTIAMWETGKRTPGIETIKKIADFFGAPPGSITGWEDNSAIKVTVGDRIKEARLKKGYSQTELAKLLGYESRSSISKIEKEGRDVPRNSILKFADVLDVTPSYLMGWEDNSAIELTVSAANIDRIKAQILSIEQKLSELKEAVEELETMGLEVEIS